jgi:hypothetical protein
MIATLIVFNDLTVDQLLLVSYVQACTTFQIIGCSTLTFKHLRKLHFLVYTALAAIEIVAGTQARTYIHTRRALELQCLSIYLGRGLNTGSGPDTMFFISGAYYVLTITLCVYLMRLMHLSKDNSQAARGGQLQRSKTFLWKTGTMYWRLIQVIYTVLSVMGWIVLVVLLIRIYVAAAHLKKSRSDRELRSFGQILALATVPVAVWDLCQSLEGGCRWCQWSAQVLMFCVEIEWYCNRQDREQPEVESSVLIEGKQDGANAV